MGRHGADVRGTITATEYQCFAERFVELIVDPKRPWLARYIMTGGLDHVPTEDEINSGDFALQVLNRIERTETELIEESLFEALHHGDREFLIPYTRKWAKESGFSREELELLLKMGMSATLRHSYRRLKSKFRFRTGGQTKLRSLHYSKILKRAEQLRPAIEKVLHEVLTTKTSHTLPEIVDYCRKDHPDACAFLMQHIGRFQEAFQDKRVLSRATVRTVAKARALADAMAGIEYDLAFSTSIERVREARRALRITKNNLPNPPQILG